MVDTGGIDNITVSPSLSPMQRADVWKLGGRFTALFSARPGQTDKATHSVHTGDAIPIASHPRKLSPKQATGIKKEVAEMLQLGGNSALRKYLSLTCCSCTQAGRASMILHGLLGSQ